MVLDMNVSSALIVTTVGHSKISFVDLLQD